jgi:hypothetical protein
LPTVSLEQVISLWPKTKGVLSFDVDHIEAAEAELDRYIERRASGRQEANPQ